jgi:hypothetical protein
MSAQFNHRQLALLEHAIKNPDAQYMVASHGSSHSAAPQTARTDLQNLERQALLTRVTSRRGYAWIPAGDLGRRLGAPAAAKRQPQPMRWRTALT